MHARALFILFLSVDDDLKEQVVDGCTLASLTFQPLCHHKAAFLFEGLHKNLIDPWIRHECNTLEQLVSGFETEYLCS